MISEKSLNGCCVFGEQAYSFTIRCTESAFKDEKAVSPTARFWLLLPKTYSKHILIMFRGLQLSAAWYSLLLRVVHQSGVFL